MPTTDFLPFATGSGANVESQATYAALSSTANGFSSGTAPSAQLNKVWRQSSVMTAAIAEMLVGFGISTVDDGNLTNLVNNLLAGFASTGFLANLGFVSSIVTGTYTSSYIKFPKIGSAPAPLLQWGMIQITSTAGTYNYPVSFPNAVQTLVGTDNSSSNVITAMFNTGLSSFQGASNSATQTSASWIALGN